MSLLPSRPSIQREDVNPEMVDLKEDTDHIFPVLRSNTARTILTELYHDPAVASELANDVGTSIQNVQHHLNNLKDADLVEVVGTWYSEKGREMKVYAPANELLMLVIGDDQETDACYDALSELRQKGS